MQNKLYVGGLPYATTEAELQELFAQAGTVASTSIIMDRATGRSKGFGFVEMSNDEEAQKAIEMFNNYELGGRNLTVNIARPMEKRDNRGGGDRRGGGNRSNRY